MKKFARLLLCLAVVLVFYQFGVLNGVRWGNGFKDATHLNDIADCSSRQDSLRTIDRGGWSDTQRAAFDAICDFPSSWRHAAEPFIPGWVVGSFLLIGSLLYVIAKIRQSWKAGRIE